MSDNHSVKGKTLYKTKTLPRFIPTAVLNCLDELLRQSIQMMESNQVPGILESVYWDAILILRQTGIHFEDLIHLKGLDGQKGGCLDQDATGSWWLLVHCKTNKTNKADNRYRRVPIETRSGVVEALYRQQERVEDIPYLSDENYLFRNQKGLVRYSSFRAALRRDLAPYLIYNDQPYVITPRQFRHTLAMEMIQQGIDIYVVKDFLGYASLREMDKYVLCQPASSIHDNIYRIKEIGFCTMPNLIPCPHQPFIYLNKQNEKKNFTIPVEILRRKSGIGRTDQEQQEVEKEIDAIKQEGDENEPPHDY